jgi:hypothetical protein
VSHELVPATGDWLDDPAPPTEDWLAGADSGAASEESDAPIEVDAPPVPAVQSERNALIAQAWSELTKSQRIWLDWAQRNHFSYAATERAMNRVQNLALVPPNRHTISRWRRQPAYKFIEGLMRSGAANEALSKNNVVLTAAQVRDAALTPKPILYQGEDTGFREIQGDIALRANEQLAKIGGHLKQDEAPSGAQGPALLVQIIQGEGKVVDVTPRGTVIDLPPPYGNS